MMTAAEVRQRAADVRQRGDATPEQRAELRALIEQKCVTDEWRQRFYEDIYRANGLSRARANSTLNYLRGLAERSSQPVYATDEQADEIRKLAATKTAPRVWLARILAHLDAGTLTYDMADLHLIDLRRMSPKPFMVPDRPAAGGAPVRDGYYSLRRGDDSIRHYRLKTFGGLRQVDQITYKVDAAGNTRTDRKRVRGYQATEVIRAVAADPAAARRLFAETTSRCTNCNRAIHDSENNPGFPHGYGPDCWDDLEAERRNSDHRAQLDNDTPGEPVTVASAGAAS